MSVTPATEVSERSLTLTRVFNAPRSVVFKAWTDPKQLMQWWGPKHHPADHIEMDVRKDGSWRNRLRSAEDGSELWHHGTFREVVAPSLLAFTFVWEEEGERGIENLVTVTFEDLGGKTRLTLHQVPFQSVEERDGHGEGWGSTLDRLTEHLEAH